MTFKIELGAVTIALAIPFDAADASVFQARLLTLDGTAVATLTDASPAFVFTGINAGEYIVEMSRLDATGAVIAGSVVSATVVAAVPAPTTKLVDVPSTLTVTVTAE